MQLGSSSDLDSVLEYEIGSGTMTEGTPLPRPRSGAIGGWLDGMACVASGVEAFALQTDWLCLGDELWIPQIDELPVPNPLSAPAGGGVAGDRLYVLGGTDDFQVEPSPLIRWPAADLPDGGTPDAGPDAGPGAGVDAGSDPEPDAGAEEPDAGIDASTPAGDGSEDGGCCRVAPGRPRRGALALLALALMVAISRRARVASGPRAAPRPCAPGRARSRGR
ncbi:MAG: hypothetical protein HYY06_20835 [Deltaproteobacteria bacterium]|nr:hypothetical protein [Deltaproteobacteria bacterium]